MADMTPTQKQAMKDVNHYIERADGSSVGARALWDQDRTDYLALCIERGTPWGVGYLSYVHAMEHAFREMTCSP